MLVNEKGNSEEDQVCGVKMNAISVNADIAQGRNSSFNGVGIAAVEG